MEKLIEVGKFMERSNTKATFFADGTRIGRESDARKLLSLREEEGSRAHWDGDRMRTIVTRREKRPPLGSLDKHPVSP